MQLFPSPAYIITIKHAKFKTFYRISSPHLTDITVRFLGYLSRIKICRVLNKRRNLIYNASTIRQNKTSKIEIKKALEWMFTISEKLKGALMVDHYLSSLVLVFISPRCLKPVGLAKDLAQNRIISIWAANSWFLFKTRFLWVLKLYKYKPG